MYLESGKVDPDRVWGDFIECNPYQEGGSSSNEQLNQSFNNNSIPVVVDISATNLKFLLGPRYKIASFIY